MDAKEIVKRASGLHEKIAADVPAIAKGHVRCEDCGHEEHVNGAECLRAGWPKCCGYTMTLLS